jgi:hypothetical protein
MSDKDNPLLHEINQRVTRTESRIVQLGDFVGANLRAKQKIEVLQDKATGEWYVQIDALDVSLSRIASALRDAGHNTGVIIIQYKDLFVGDIDMDEVNRAKE